MSRSSGLSKTLNCLTSTVYICKQVLISPEGRTCISIISYYIISYQLWFIAQLVRALHSGILQFTNLSPNESDFLSIKLLLQLQIVNYDYITEQKKYRVFMTNNELFSDKVNVEQYSPSSSSSSSGKGPMTLTVTTPPLTKVWFNGKSTLPDVKIKTFTWYRALS